MSEAKKKVPVPLVILGVLAIGYAGYKLYREHRPHEWSGTVEVNTIDVGSRSGGRVKAVRVREGDRVEPGQVLVELEPGDLEAQGMMAQGALDQAEAVLERVEGGARPEEIAQANARAKTAAAALNQYRAGARSEEVGAARARLSAQEASVEKTRSDAERARKLFAMQAISKAEADTAETTLRSAQAQRDALKEALRELENGARKEEVQQAEGRALEAQASAKLVSGGSRIEDIKAARGQVLAAQGKRDSIKIALAELSIRAPKAARVESLELRPGDLLAANATAARLAEDDQLYVRIFVPETEIGNAKQLLVTPIHPLGLMLGKLAPSLVLGVFEASLVLFAMRFGFDVPIRGNLLFLAVMVIVYLFSLLAMGLLVSTRAKSQSEAMQSAQMLFLPSIFLSGYIFPAAGLPLPLYLIGRCLPATHMIEIMRGIVLRDAGPRELWPNVLALVVMGIFLVGLSARRFQKVAL